MEKTRDKFNLKRVKMAFATVLALVALAGVLQVVLAVLSLADAEVMGFLEGRAVKEERHPFARVVRAMPRRVVAVV